MSKDMGARRSGKETEASAASHRTLHEIQRIKSACSPAENDGEDVISYAKEIVNLRRVGHNLVCGAKAALEDMEWSTSQGRVAYELLRLAVAEAEREPGVAISGHDLWSWAAGQ